VNCIYYNLILFHNEKISNYIVCLDNRWAAEEAIMIKILFLSLFAVIAVILIVSTAARVKAIPSSNYTIAGLNNKTVNIAIRNQDRLLNIARLYNASSIKIKGLNAAGGVLACLGADIYLHTINSSNFWYSVTKQILDNCDDYVTDQFSNKTSGLYGEGSNATMVNIAKEYLQSSGIDLVS
jgi:hypothetical protein